MASADVLHVFPSNPSFSPLDVSTTSKRKRELEPKTAMNPVDLLSSGPVEKIAFDVTKHLNFVPPTKIYTMEEIGLADRGVSPNAVSEPFQLFTIEAIKQMRAEVLRREIFAKCQYASNLAKGQLRGFAPEFAPFVYDAWHSPEVLAIISKVAGVELVPQMDFEIAHINVSLQSEADKEEAAVALAEKASRDADEGVSGCPWEEDKPIVDWHTDSYPFVCVLMLSDCTNMIGGETALRTGSGDIMRIRGPQMGSACILQGRYIEHQALRALGCPERITMVTSFRPKSAMVKDDTVLTTVRAISDLSELYSQYTEYRLEILEERIRSHLKEIRDRKRARRPFNTRASKRFIAEQESFLAAMNRELVDEDKVTKGFTDSDGHLFSEELRVKQKKKACIMSESQS